MTNDWSESIQNITAIIHSGPPLDLEDLENQLSEHGTPNPIEVDVYTHRHVADEHWEDSHEYYTPINGEGSDELYYLGTLGQYL